MRWSVVGKQYLKLIHDVALNPSVIERAILRPLYDHPCKEPDFFRETKEILVTIRPLLYYIVSELSKNAKRLIEWTSSNR